MNSFSTLNNALAAGPIPRMLGFDRTPRGERAAAVLMLFTQQADPALTFVTRAETLRRHAGQIALPGGAVDETDVDSSDTALREAQEEIGLERSGVNILGKLPPLWVPASRYDVTTVLASWDGQQLLRPVDPGETGAVHNFRVSELADPNNRVTAVHPSGFRTVAFVLQEQFIWGLTAHLVDWVLDLGGWSQPWAHSKEAVIPQRYLRD